MEFDIDHIIEKRYALIQRLCFACCISADTVSDTDDAATEVVDRPVRLLLSYKSWLFAALFSTGVLFFLTRSGLSYVIIIDDKTVRIKERKNNIHEMALAAGLALLCAQPFIYRLQCAEVNPPCRDVIDTTRKSIFLVKYDLSDNLLCELCK